MPAGIDQELQECFLPSTHLVLFPHVHPQGHQFQIGDDIDSLAPHARVTLRVMQGMI